MSFAAHGSFSAFANLNIMADAPLKAACAAGGDHEARTGLFKVSRVHHVELWANDATSAYKRLQAGLGLTMVAKSDLSTGNTLCASYALQSGDLLLAVTAPHSLNAPRGGACGAAGGALPGYCPLTAHEFARKHGLAVRAIGLAVDDAAAAYAAATSRGAVGILAPTRLGGAIIAEVAMMGDVVLRFVSGDCEGPFLPGYAPTPAAPRVCFGLRRLGGVAAATMSLPKAAAYITAITGFRSAAAGPNSKALSDDDGAIQLSVNEPTDFVHGSCAVQAFLDHHEGPGVQQLALETDDIASTLRQMRAAIGGLDFEPPAGNASSIHALLADVLTQQQCAELAELGVTAELDGCDVVLRAVTQPIGDRPTASVAIVQRVAGAHHSAASSDDEMDCFHL